MRDEIRYLIDVLSRSLVQSEGFARELADLAHQLEQDGSFIVAQGMLSLSRHQRVEGIKARAEIAALSDRSSSQLRDFRTAEEGGWVQALRTRIIHD